MKKIILITLSSFFLIFIAEKSFAQKKLIMEHDAVAAEAKSELDSLMSPAGALQLEAAKKNLKGEYIIDLTIHEKGKILSVFMVSSDADDVKMQNAAKDLIRTVQFNFKMPKDKTYKFQYTFVFK